MKKILLLTTVTALLSSCGIYTKYQPETTAPIIFMVKERRQ